ncbi:hypothetical protein U1Q18_003874 [Sarracenia purpurea var. burkii]
MTLCKPEEKSMKKGISKIVSSGFIVDPSVWSWANPAKKGAHRWKTSEMKHIGAGRNHGSEIHTIFVDQLLELMHRA